MTVSLREVGCDQTNGRRPPGIFFKKPNNTATTVLKTSRLPELVLVMEVDMVAGAIAGAAARLVVAPLDVIKIRWQVHDARPAGMVATVTQTLRHEGALAFWKGNLAAQLLAMVYSSAQFPAYHAVWPYFQVLNSHSSYVSKSNSSLTV